MKSKCLGEIRRLVGYNHYNTIIKKIDWGRNYFQDIWSNSKLNFCLEFCDDSTWNMFCHIL